ncbi:hypothetical protein C8Q80DRAFT_939757 [Daedaleopsis nitida]|nr:hypothetical protein C8Q80DRAFT_939757 [Daedaleopsis nitida]
MLALALAPISVTPIACSLNPCPYVPSRLPRTHRPSRIRITHTHTVPSTCPCHARRTQSNAPSVMLCYILNVRRSHPAPPRTTGRLRRLRHVHVTKRQNSKRSAIGDRELWRWLIRVRFGVLASSRRA